MTSTVDIRKIFIKSETDNNKQYEMYYMIWKNENTPKKLFVPALVISIGVSANILKNMILKTLNCGKMLKVLIRNIYYVDLF
jgi:hypothetical protein